MYLVFTILQSGESEYDTAIIVKEFISQEVSRSGLRRKVHLEAKISLQSSLLHISPWKREVNIKNADLVL